MNTEVVSTLLTGNIESTSSVKVQHKKCSGDGDRDNQHRFTRVHGGLLVSVVIYMSEW